MEQLITVYNCKNKSSCEEKGEHVEDSPDQQAPLKKDRQLESATALVLLGNNPDGIKKELIIL